MINYVTGDATDPQGDGTKIIVHVCNNIGTWGAGFVKALSAKWDAPEDNYRKWFRRADRYSEPFQLGNVQYVGVTNNIIVANMIAQSGVVNDNNVKPIRYVALGKCLEKIASDIRAFRVRDSIHMPRIGCGLAGGDWNIVEILINETMPDLSVTVYDLE